MHIKLNLTEEEIRVTHAWYMKDHNRSLNQAGQRLGMSGVGLAYNFRKLGLTVKPRGRGWGKKEIAHRFFSHVQKTEACWLWMGYRQRHGYGLIGIDGKTQFAHRVSYQIHYGPIPEGLNVLHSCDNPPCVNPDHLFLGTPADNAKDRDKKGRLNPRKGEANPFAKLTEAKVVEIRRRYQQEGIGCKELAKEYEVSQPAIRSIVKRKSWKHVG